MFLRDMEIVCSLVLGDGVGLGSGFRRLHHAPTGSAFLTEFTLVCVRWGGVPSK